MTQLLSHQPGIERELPFIWRRRYAIRAVLLGSVAILALAVMNLAA